MTVQFICDACGDTAPPGTVTGGIPRQWCVDYIYDRGAGGTNRCRRIDHYCTRPECRAVQRERADERQGRARRARGDVPRPATAADPTPAPRPTRGRGATQAPPRATTDDPGDDQGSLF